MMARWLHTLHQFQFTIVHEPEVTMAMLTGCPGPPLTLADSVPVLNAHG